MGKKKTESSKLVARLKLHHLSTYGRTLYYTLVMLSYTVLYLKKKIPIRRSI